MSSGWRSAIESYSVGGTPGLLLLPGPDITWFCTFECARPIAWPSSCTATRLSDAAEVTHLTLSVVSASISTPLLPEVNVTPATLAAPLGGADRSPHPMTFSLGEDGLPLIS